MQQITIKIWCNNVENAMYKALVSTLLLDSRTYTKVKEPEAADMWCLVDEGSDINTMVDLYKMLPKKPKVIYLARHFQPPPISEWVFFRSPIHATALFNWVKSQEFTNTPIGSICQRSKEDSSANNTVNLRIDEKASSGGESDELTKQRWYHEPFKLQYWPNVTQYSDSPDIIVICTGMLRDWITYDSLQQTSLPIDVIEEMLYDAAEEKNLQYKYASPSDFESNRSKEQSKKIPVEKDNATSSQLSEETHVDSSSTDTKTSSSRHSNDRNHGFFKNLLNRFIN